jgi:hypothetical protein
VFFSGAYRLLQIHHSVTYCVILAVLSLMVIRASYLLGCAARRKKNWNVRTNQTSNDAAPARSIASRLAQADIG